MIKKIRENHSEIIWKTEQNEKLFIKNWNEFKFGGNNRKIY